MTALPNLYLAFFLASSVTSVLSGQELVAEVPGRQEIRVGIIGLDTSHSIAFAKALNDPDAAAPLDRCRVICAFPKGSTDIESSSSRIPKYTEQMHGMGVRIVDSIDELVANVDAVLLETNDGRLHLEQVLPVLKANKPVFVDKPFAASLADVIAIQMAAKHYGTPVFSASSLRYSRPTQLARQGQLVGRVLGCETFSPATREATHPDLYWYGIHGVEQLITVMGPGCDSVSRTSSEGTDVVVGLWSDGRIGAFRGNRTGPSGYGGTVFGEDGQASTGGYEGYEALVGEIAGFFVSQNPPVDGLETLEIYAFMSAADQSWEADSKSVRLKDVIGSASIEARQRLEKAGILIDQDSHGNSEHPVSCNGS